MQARVVTDDLAGCRLRLEERWDAAFDQIAHFKHRLVDLIAHLQGVSAIDKDSGSLTQDHRRAGRAGKTRRPGQAIIGGGQVLVVVLILMRDQETIQALLGHGGTDQGDVTGTKAAVGALIEGQAHGVSSVGVGGRQVAITCPCADRSVNDVAAPR